MTYLVLRIVANLALVDSITYFWIVFIIHFLKKVMLFQYQQPDQWVKVVHQGTFQGPINFEYK